MAEPAEAEHLGDAVCAIGGTSTMEDMQQDEIKDQEAQDQQDFANRLKVAKVHELAFLKQRQIVTRAVQSLEQLHLEYSVQTHKTSKSSRKENGSGDMSSASTSLESTTTSSSSLSSSSRASSIITDAEISTDSDDTRYEEPKRSTAATDSQSSEQQQQQQQVDTMTAVQQTLKDVQEQATADAAAAAAVAALQGITRGQARSHSRPRKGPQHVWNGSSRQFSTALNKAIAAAARGGRWPGETREDTLADSPRSTSTTASSRTSSSRAASSKPDVRRSRTNQPCRHVEGNRAVSRTQAATFDADSPPPGFGFQAYDSSRSSAGEAAGTYQHVAHRPVQSSAPHPVYAAAQAPPGFAPAAPPLPPPGFAGVRCAAGDAGYSPQTPRSRMSSPSAASHAARTPASGRSAQSRRVGQSRLFKGAMAGAVAERC